MSATSKNKFTAQIEIIGINPFVFLPDKALEKLFAEAGKSKGKIPVKMKIDGHLFTQTLVKYAGHWRLYLNTPMRKAAAKDVGDTAVFEIEYDSADRTIPIHDKLAKALAKNKEAKKVFDALSPSLQAEFSRYLSALKTEESVERNVLKAINFLLGKERFIGRDKPVLSRKKSA
jgi:hypothetical protein